MTKNWNIDGAMEIDNLHDLVGGQVRTAVNTGEMHDICGFNGHDGTLQIATGDSTALGGS